MEVNFVDIINMYMIFVKYDILSNISILTYRCIPCDILARYRFKKSRSYVIYRSEGL